MTIKIYEELLAEADIKQFILDTEGIEEEATVLPKMAKVYPKADPNDLSIPSRPFRVKTGQAQQISAELLAERMTVREKLEFEVVGAEELKQMDETVSTLLETSMWQEADEKLPQPETVVETAVVEQTVSVQVTA